MSHRIIRFLSDYAIVKSRPIMMIASMNQVNHLGGYVTDTESLAFLVKDNKFIKLCRDHCGPFFLDDEKHLSQSQAISLSKQTIETDIAHGFELIHIDTSRCDESLNVAETLLNFSLKLKSDIEFEFGTEENIGIRTNIEKFKDTVNFATNFDAIKFVVAQTGSLVMENRQIGNIEPDNITKLIDIANQNNICLKEHNADYLTTEALRLRKFLGIHAMNIAPQLGYIETKTILELALKFKVSYTDFANLVINQSKWKKWMLSTEDYMKILVAGHYHFSTYEYKILNDRLNLYIDVDNEVRQAIYQILDQYFENFYL